VSLSSHQQRVVTGTVLIALLAGVIFSGSTLVQAAVVVVLSCAALTEFWSMVWTEGKKGMQAMGLVLSVPVVVLPQAGVGAGGLLPACLWIVGLVYVFGGRLSRDMSLTDAALLFFGLVYIPFILQFLISLTTVEQVYVLAAVFGADTAAFYGGSKWGRRKLCPSISPKKTWMGFGSGLAACVAVSLIWGLIWGQAGWAVWFGVGTALCVGAQAGDLFESAVKRELKVKDSGVLLPGHGGVLDRIDSLLLALPVYMAITWVYPLFG
jgi:phosphatidate cytidylyltransferase